MTTVVGWIAARGPVRDGLDVATAADLVWMLTSPEIHHMLLEKRGWSRSQYELWRRDTLEHTLLGEAGGSPP